MSLYLFCINKTCGNIVFYLNKDTTMARGARTPLLVPYYMPLANSKLNQLCLCIFFSVNKTCGNIVCYLNKDTTMARGARTPLVVPYNMHSANSKFDQLCLCIFFASTKHVEILFAISIEILQWLEELGHPLCTL